MHDFCVISLSDLLTPWDQIAKRLVCAAEGDSVIVLYNPGSKRRRGHLRRACEILLERKHPETVCGWSAMWEERGVKSEFSPCRR